MCLSCLEKLMFLGTAKLKTRGSFRWATRGGRANTEAAAAILKSQHVDYVPWTVLKKRVRVQGLELRVLHLEDLGGFTSGVGFSEKGIRYLKNFHL